MIRILQWFNFGDKLIQWVLLFTQMKLAVMNNGYTAEYLTPSQGLFQGNPIASFLFLLVIEVLATKLRNNKKIKGLSVNNQELLLILFADDLGMLLEYNQGVWSKVVKELTLLTSLIGSEINYDKQKYID